MVSSMKRRMPGNCLKYWMIISAASLRGMPQPLRQAEGGNAVGDAVVHHLRLAAHLGSHHLREQAIDLGGGGGVDIRAGAEGLEQSRFAAQPRDDAQLDLRIIRREQPVLAVAGNEGLADLLPLLGADGDILQVRVLRIEPAGAGDDLVESRVDAAGLGPDGRREGVGVGGFELRGGAIFQRCWMISWSGANWARVCSSVAYWPVRVFLGAAADLEDVEQDLAQLSGRIQVESRAGQASDGLFKRLISRASCARKFGQRRGVHAARPRTPFGPAPE